MASELTGETELGPTYRVPKRLPNVKDPSLPSSVPTTSNRDGGGGPSEFDRPKKKFVEYFYDKKTGAFLGRTGKSWIQIIAYSCMYLIFLSAFTMVILYASLKILKVLKEYQHFDKTELLTYPEHGIGLSATPTSEHSYPLIWYKNGDKDDYEKYVQALDKLLSSNRRKRELNKLGPCGQSPYGYGSQPCVIVRINKQLKWSGRPLRLNSTRAKSAPGEVQKWMRADETKLWLQCSGFHSYDKEHIGRIKYYPDPPGFDASMFPLEKDRKSPLVAIQITDFTVGISLAIQCNLWYDAGPSTIDFMLYVAPADRIGYVSPTIVNV